MTSSKKTIDEFAVIRKQVQVLSQENNDILKHIEDRMGELVILKYEYMLKCDIQQKDSEMNGKCPWTLQSIPITQKVTDLMENWTYNGEELKNDFVFDSIGDFSLKNYNDVKRVTDILSKILDKYVKFLADSDDTRAGLYILLSNSKLLHTTLKELKLMTVNAKDSNDSLQDHMFDLFTSFKEISSIIPSASLNINVSQSPIYVKDFASLKCKNTLENHTPGVSQLQTCHFKDKDYLVSGCHKGSIKLWDLTNKSPEQTINECNDAVCSIVVYFKNSTQYLVAGTNCKILLLNLSDRKITATLSGHSSYVYALKTYQHDNKTILVSGSADKTIKLWDLDNNVLITTLHGHTSYIFALNMFNQDGDTFMASGGGDKTVKIWNMNNKSLVTTLTESPICIRSLISFEYEEKRILAAGGGDGTIRLWDMNDYSYLGDLKGHSNYINALSVTRCKSKIFLVSGGSDKTIKVWNLEEKRVLKNLTGHTGQISTLKAFYHNDEAYLASGDSRGFIKIWSA